MDTIDDTELDAQLSEGADLQLLRVCVAPGAGSIPGSVTLPDGIDQVDVLDPDRRTVIYGCGPDCEAAATAATGLHSVGFRHVQLFPGGMDGWRRAGRPIQH